MTTEQVVRLRRSASRAATTWLSEQIAAAGFVNVTAFAEAQGWREGTANNWASGRSRPPWWAFEPLALALGIPVERLVTELWGEQVGDLCDCARQCGGVKVLPIRPNTRQLAISRRCVTCGSEKPYPRKGQHSPICVSCINLGRERVERVTFTCVGYTLIGGKKVSHAPRCKRTYTPYPSNMRATIKNSEARARTQPQAERGFYDLQAKTYRSGPCVSASLRLAERLQRVKQITSERIRSSDHLARLEHVYRAVLFPELAAARRRQRPTGNSSPRGPYTQQHRDHIAIGQIMAHWSQPEAALPEAIVRHCVSCDLLLFAKPSDGDPHQHQPCYLTFRWSPGGRLAQRRGDVVQPHGRPSRHPCSDDHVLGFAWALQNHLGKRSLRNIAAAYGVTYSAVKSAVKHIIDYLPPRELVTKGFRHHVELLGAAVAGN